MTHCILPESLSDSERDGDQSSALDVIRDNASSLETSHGFTTDSIICSVLGKGFTSAFQWPRQSLLVRYTDSSALCDWLYT